jgi:hypothetical protein
VAGSSSRQMWRLSSPQQEQHVARVELAGLWTGAAGGASEAKHRPVQKGLERRSIGVRRAGGCLRRNVYVELGGGQAWSRPGRMVNWRWEEERKKERA